MGEARHSESFELRAGFESGGVTGGLELGPYASHYQELFADALEDGVITAEERERLDKVADNLGLDRAKLQQVEQAMIHAYEAHTRIKVVEEWESGPESIQPIQVPAAGDEGRALLIAQIDRLNARIRELEAELREARSHVNVEVDLGELEQVEVVDESLERLRARIRRDPTNPRVLGAFFKACVQVADLDGQYRAAQALVVVGAGDASHEALIAAHEPEGLVLPQRSLDVANWSEELYHPDLEIVTGNILALVAPAALVGRAAALRRDKKLLQLPEESKHDVMSSTIAAVRALGWAATVLGMPAPSVYTDSTRSVGYASVPDVPPFSLLGKGVLTGRTPKEHAFLAARHMTYYRAEFFAKVLLPGVQDLENLFVAALLLGSPGLPIAEHLRTRVQPLSAALAPLLSQAKLDSLRQQFKHFVADGGRTNLLRWSESVEKTACRAGLLLCDDLRTAAALLEQEEGPRGPLLTDLLGFLVSEPCSHLRERLGIVLIPARARGAS